MIQVQITQHGTLNDKEYIDSYNMGYTKQKVSEDYTLSARSLDSYYLLETTIPQEKYYF